MAKPSTDTANLSSAKLNSEDITRSGTPSDNGPGSKQLRCTNTKEHEDEEHHARLGQYTAVLWRHNRMTDITLCLNNRCYQAHKAVLSCYSPYFKDILLRKENQTNELHIDLPNVTGSAFDILLSYMYTGELNVTCQTLGDVYTAARKLGMRDALQKCTDLLSGKTKRLVNSIFIYVTAKNLGMEDASSRAMNTMKKHFEQLVGTPEFLDMDVNQVCEFLSADELATRSEVFVYLAALKWLNRKYMEREPHAVRVLGCVRFPQMTLEEVLACHNPPLLPAVTELRPVKEALLKGTCYVAARLIGQQQRFKDYMCRPRTYLLARESVVLWDTSIYDSNRYNQYKREQAATKIQSNYRGYRTRKSLKEMSMDPNVNGDAQEEKTRSSQSPRPSKSKERKSSRSSKDAAKNLRPSQKFRGTSTEHAAAGKIQKHYKRYKQRKIKEDGYSFEYEEEAFESELSSATMASPTRTGLSNQVKSPDQNFNSLRNNELSSEEGENESSDSLPIIRYNEYGDKLDHKRSKNIRHTIHIDGPFMSDSAVMKRSSQAGEGFDNNLSIGPLETPGQTVQSEQTSVIVTLGGTNPLDPKDKTVGKSFMKFSPVENSWVECGQLPEPRYYHCSVLVDKSIYIIGGSDFQKSRSSSKIVAVSSCFRYDLDKNKWFRIQDMMHCRAYHGAATLFGNIYVVGGKNEYDRSLSSVEYYMPNHDSWYEMQPGLGNPRTAMGVAAYRDFLWVVGGMVEDHSGKLSVVRDVECYDPKTERWWYKQVLLPTPRCYVTLVECNTKLYMLGGSAYNEADNAQSLNIVADVYWYDSINNQWVMDVPLPFPRHRAAAATVGKAIYVLGGLIAFDMTAISDVIAHSEDMTDWSTCTPLPTPRSGFTALTLPKLPKLSKL